SDGFFNPGLGEECRQVLDCDVSGHKHDSKRSADDHHAGFLCLGQVCQQFRMAGEMTAGHVDRFLIDRCCDDAVDTTKLCKLHGFLDEEHGRRSGFRCRDSTQEPPKGMIERVQHVKMI